MLVTSIKYVPGNKRQIKIRQVLYNQICSCYRSCDIDNKKKKSYKTDP